MSFLHHFPHPLPLLPLGSPNSLTMTMPGAEPELHGLARMVGRGVGDLNAMGWGLLHVCAVVGTVP